MPGKVQIPYFKKFFLCKSDQTVENKLPSKDVESSSSLEVLKSHLGVTLGIGVRDGCGGAG